MNMPVDVKPSTIEDVVVTPADAADDDQRVMLAHSTAEGKIFFLAQDWSGDGDNVEFEISPDDAFEFAEALTTLGTQALSAQAAAEDGGEDVLMDEAETVEMFNLPDLPGPFMCSECGEFSDYADELCNPIDTTDVDHGGVCDPEQIGRAHV